MQASGNNSGDSKKNPIYIGGELYILDKSAQSEYCRFFLVDELLRSEEFRDQHLTIEEMCNLCGVSRSGYNAWKKRQIEGEKHTEKQKQKEELQAKMISIVRRLNFVPGTRTFCLLLFNLFQEDIGRKKCRTLMAEMHLSANKPLKDPYKHMATHDHEYAVPAENLVAREFIVDPRKVIVTDITYIPYGQNKEVIYLCIFKDCYTREILGEAVSERMTVDDLVKPAYDLMMKRHGAELKKPDVYLHSDQGSQFLSTTFQQMLKDDNFIQSVSGRGNSLDNAPAESFFADFKKNVLPALQLAKTSDQAMTMTLNYVNRYTHEIPRYELAGLPPAKFYCYVKTGIYPCEEYFGVKASELAPIESLIQRTNLEFERKRRKSAERAKRRREAEKSSPGKNPMNIVNRDIDIIEKEQKECEELVQKAEERKAFLENLLKKAVFDLTCSADNQMKR